MPTPRPADRLDAATARRLAAVAARLTSGHDGERLAACAAIERLLGPRGLRLWRGKFTAKQRSKILEIAARAGVA